MFVSLKGCKDDKILRHYDFKNLGMKNEGMKEGMKEWKNEGIKELRRDRGSLEIYSNA